MNETKTEPTQPAAPAKAAVKPATKPTAPPELTKPETVTPFFKHSLEGFNDFLKESPKEWLPTMMVRIANKCLAEKVFATPGAMAEAIVGASKK